MRINVECCMRRSGELEPYMFRLGERRLHVARIVERLIQAGERIFTVCVDDGRCFVLRQDLANGDWSLARVLPARFA